MATVWHTIAPFDGRTRYAGASQSLTSWQAIVSSNEVEAHERRFSDGLHFMVEQGTRGAVRRGMTPLLLGGDHSLTWSTARALFDVYGEFTIIHFDAHEDAHPSADVNHWSVFHHIKKRLTSRIVGLGYRAGCAPKDGTLRTLVNGPAYVSLDVDYFDPSHVSGVTAPCPCVEPYFCNLESLDASLKQLRGPIIGADIVEWTGAPTDSTEYGFMSDVYRCVIEAIGRGSR